MTTRRSDDLPYEIEIVEHEDRCQFTPETCMDDLCRGSDIGLCGNANVGGYEVWADDPDDDNGYADWDGQE